MTLLRQRMIEDRHLQNLAPSGRARSPKYKVRGPDDPMTSTCTRNRGSISFNESGGNGSCTYVCAPLFYKTYPKARCEITAKRSHREVRPALIPRTVRSIVNGHASAITD
jgi:hypothetical protein